ncbi:hypothetical protein [Pedobacter sp. N23S346]|uniref:hypothetical protein n=1 Tax=Pedobacter sp. N23S346 TaxID=3402750 RepID=UPI003ACA5028
MFSLNQSSKQLTVLISWINSKKINLTGILVILLSLTCVKSYSQISGTGCDFGGQIAMLYLGTATYYGNKNDIVEVYSSSSAVPINKGNGRAYDCAAVNDYGEFQVWDPSIQPYGGMRTVPASHDIRRSSSSRQHECVVASSRYATPDGEGTIVGYTYKDPNKCDASRPNHLPLDDFMPLLIVSAGVLAFFLIRN